MQDTAIDILSTIVQHSPVPLSPILINTAFPATVKCILSTDDNAIMQSGGECLRTFISGKFLLNSISIPLYDFDHSMKILFFLNEKQFHTFSSIT